MQYMTVSLNTVCHFLLQGMCLEWCKNCDAGLPRPDLVLFLDLTPEQARARGGYGTERYENEKFQNRVRETYQKLRDNSWKVSREEQRYRNSGILKSLLVLLMFYLILLDLLHMNIILVAALHIFCWIRGHYDIYQASHQPLSLQVLQCSNFANLL